MNRKNLFRKLFFFSLMLVPCSVLADAVQYLVVTEKGGQETTFALAEKPVVTMQEGMMRVEASSTTFEKALEEIAKYSFSETGNDNGIGETKATNAGKAVNMAAGTVSFAGLTAGSKVVVFTTDGKVVGSATASTDGTAMLDLNGLGNGVFVVTTEGGSYKVSVRK